MGFLQSWVIGDDGKAVKADELREDQGETGGSLPEDEVENSPAIDAPPNPAAEYREDEEADAQGYQQNFDLYNFGPSAKPDTRPLIERDPATPDQAGERIAKAIIDAINNPPTLGRCYTFHVGKDTNPKDAIGTRKVPMSTVPAQVMAEIGLGMLEGAIKYRRHNYRVAGVRASVYYDATMRHLMLWWEGQDIDPDSLLSHITKALASLTVLRDAMLQQKLTDDRPPPAINQNWLKGLNALAADLLDRYEDHKPPYTRRDVDGEISG